MNKIKYRYVIHVDNKGYLRAGSQAHNYLHDGAGYEPRYTDDLQIARIFTNKSAAANCKVAKYDGAKILPIQLALAEEIPTK